MGKLHEVLKEGPKILKKAWVRLAQEQDLNASLKPFFHALKLEPLHLDSNVVTKAQDTSSENIKCYIIYKANSPHGDYMEWVKTGNGNLCWHQFVFDWQVVSSWTVRDVYWCWPLRQRAERLQASGWQDFHSNGKYQKGIGTLNANMLIQCWKIILAWPQQTRFLDFEDLCLIHWGCLKLAIRNCCAVCLVFQSRLMLFESWEVLRSVGVYQ